MTKFLDRRFEHWSESQCAQYALPQDAHVLCAFMNQAVASNGFQLRAQKCLLMYRLDEFYQQIYISTLGGIVQSGTKQPLRRAGAKDLGGGVLDCGLAMGWYTHIQGGPIKLIHGFFKYTLQIMAIAILGKWLRKFSQLGSIDPFLPIGDLFRAGDLEPLTILDGGDELAGIEQ